MSRVAAAVVGSLLVGSVLIGCGNPTGGNSHCDARTGSLDTQNQCIDLESPDPITAAGFQAVCAGVSGTVSDGLCDHATALGGCRTKEGAGTRTNWYYTSKDDKTAADAQAKCKMGDTFIPVSGADDGGGTTRDGSPSTSDGGGTVKSDGGASALDPPCAAYVACWLALTGVDHTADVALCTTGTAACKTICDRENPALSAALGCRVGVNGKTFGNTPECAGTPDVGCTDMKGATSPDLQVTASADMQTITSSDIGIAGAVDMRIGPSPDLAMGTLFAPDLFGIGAGDASTDMAVTASGDIAMTLPGDMATSVPVDLGAASDAVAAVDQTSSGDLVTRDLTSAPTPAACTGSADGHWSNVIALIPCTSTIADVSGGSSVIATFNSPTVSSSPSGAPGGASCRLGNSGGINTGNGFSVTLPSSLGSGDFTVELSVYQTAWNDPTDQQSNLLLSSTAYPPSAGTFPVLFSQKTVGHVEYVGGMGVALYTDSGSALNQWESYAVSRVSGTVYLFRDGALLTSFADTTDYSDTTFFIGHQMNGGYNALMGSVGQIRVTKGLGRYTSSYAVCANGFATSG